ncbi:MAG TPA: LPS export ABC transporter periplasmic protein LptC [Terriglobales bacterium]|nr:LPS export ABC transporter periplasmic protein LptC [Terriglobales bacterium]
MPVNVRRLRLWLVTSGLLLVAVVVGFIAYGQYRTRQIIRRLPQKLGANIQQTAQGFTYSQSEGGRTLFTIHASQMVQFRSGGRAELKDVNITVYGRDASRFDQIYGAGFEYDPQQKIVRATGEVHIDLQADAEGVQHPDQAPPQELKNPIHVKTSGLEFNEASGTARTDEQVEFRTPQASGSARGAIYDSRQRTLTLEHDVHLLTEAAVAGSSPLAIGSRRKPKAAAAKRDAAPAEINAASAVLRSESRTATLENVLARRGPETLRARTAIVSLRQDSTLERIAAAGDVQGEEGGPEGARFHAAKLDLEFSPASEVTRGELSGGASYESHGRRAMHGSAGRVIATFSEGNTLEKIQAFDKVDAFQDAGASRTGRGSKGAAGNAQAMELKAPALDLFTREGRHLDRAITTGASQIILSEAAGAASPAAGTGQTTISANQFVARFDGQNHIQTLQGSSAGAEPVNVVSRAPGHADRVTSSRTLEIAFAPGSDTVSRIQQAGDFHYTEGARSAASEQANYTAATNLLTLTGTPRYHDDQVQLAADSMALNRASSEIRATGDVKTTYLPQSSSAPANAAMFSSAAPVHVTSRELVAQRSAGKANFSGGARLWQGGNLVEAPAITFESQGRSVDAEGSAAQPVHSVFVQAGQNGRTIPVDVASPRLTYSGNQAHFTGGVTVVSADSTLLAQRIDVVLRQQQQSGGQTSQVVEAAGSGPAQVERIIAQGNVTIVQPGRKANGQKLVYVAADQSFTLTGGPPSIFDAERGQITGNSLTFYTHDDRVLIENLANGGTKTVIHTRVTK